MSFVVNPDTGNDKEKTSDGPTPSLPHANNVSPSVQDKLYCKLLTSKRALVVHIKHLKNELEWAKGNDLDDLATQFQEVRISFAGYKTRVNENICDPEIAAQPPNDAEDLFSRCLGLHDITMGDALCISADLSRKLEHTGLAGWPQRNKVSS